jgi:DNA-binding transcriptional LysR family regulator
MLSPIEAEALAALERYGSLREAAIALDITMQALATRLRRAHAKMEDSKWIR